MRDVLRANTTKELCWRRTHTHQLHIRRPDKGLPGSLSAACARIISVVLPSCIIIGRPGDNYRSCWFCIKSHNGRIYTFPHTRALTIRCGGPLRLPPQPPYSPHTTTVKHTPWCCMWKMPSVYMYIYNTQCRLRLLAPCAKTVEAVTNCNIDFRPQMVECWWHLVILVLKLLPIYYILCMWVFSHNLPLSLLARLLALSPSPAHISQATHIIHNSYSCVLWLLFRRADAKSTHTHTHTPIRLCCLRMYVERITFCITWQKFIGRRALTLLDSFISVVLFLPLSRPPLLHPKHSACTRRRLRVHPIDLEFTFYSSYFIHIAKKEK